MLYPYQESFVSNILTALKTNQKVLAQLPTGAGKTFCFCHICQLASKGGKRVLILVHREELIDQTSTSLIKMGVINEKITSRKRKLENFANVYVAMEKTIHNRLTKNPVFLKDIDLIIADEVHIQLFEKIYDLFPSAKVIGFTATPSVLNRVTFFKCDICGSEHQENTSCCGIETMEWTKPYTLSEVYDTIVCGIGISELIEQDKLVKEISIVKKSVDTSKLQIDKSGEFTQKSQNHAFGATESVTALTDDYESLCKGKKTMIFTGSTKVNKLILAAMLGRGINARGYDSVNNDSKERTDTVKWFKSEDDAVLINTGVFTAGFDCQDVEVIMLYRSTQSLSLFIQIVGRGARTYPGKFNFLLVDYGDNIDRLGEWSDPTRDWESIFYNGLGKPKPKREALEAVNQCDDCGALYPASQPGCPHCGAIPKPKKKRVQKGEDYELVPIAPMPPPSGGRIVEYARSQGQGSNFAFKVLTGQVVDLFRFYGVKSDAYHRSVESGEFERKVGPMIRKAYFVIIRSGLDGANRRLSRVVNDIKNKLDKIYESNN